MLELYNSIKPNCKMKGDMLSNYYKLIQSFKDSTGLKLPKSTCQSKSNLRVIEKYLKGTGQL